jgi:hypothetical protein
MIGCKLELGGFTGVRTYPALRTACQRSSQCALIAMLNKIHFISTFCYYSFPVQFGYVHLCPLGPNNRSLLV